MTAADLSYAAVMARKSEIVRRSLGIDYDEFVSSPIAFDYERMMRETGYDLDDVARIQAETKVGKRPSIRNTSPDAASCRRSRTARTRGSSSELGLAATESARSISRDSSGASVTPLGVTIAPWQTHATPAAQ